VASASRCQQQAVESADSLLHAISRAPDSYLQNWGPSDTGRPTPEFTFQALLQPGAGARSKMSSSANCTFLFCMYVCRRLTGRIRKDIDNLSNLGNPAEHSQLGYVARRIFKTRAARPRHPKNLIAQSVEIKLRPRSIQNLGLP
jgi:hypothetical protein